MADGGESEGAFLERLGTDGWKWAEELADMLGRTNSVRDITDLKVKLSGWCSNMIEAGRDAGARGIQEAIARADALDQRRQEQISNQKATIDRLMAERGA